MYAECAGIVEINDDERQRVEKVVNEILAKQAYGPSVTHLTEHFIDVQGTAPIRHKPRQMSPKMFEIDRGEL